MNYKNLILFTLSTAVSFFFLFRLVDWIEPVQAAPENNCTHIGSVGVVSYSYCKDPNTGLEFIGSSNGYMEIIK